MSTPELIIHSLGTIGSTQVHARAVLADPGDIDLTQPHCFIAESQTGGVGRTGNPWHSPTGGLWLTLLWPVVPSALPAAKPRPTLAQTLHGLGIKVGMAVLESVRGVLTRAGLDDEIARLKWPNDVLIHEKKLAGMICEVVASPAPDQRPTALIIGIGINADFAVAGLSEPLRSSATTLRDVVGAPIDVVRLRDDLLARLVRQLLTPGLPPATLAAAYAALYKAGERHSVRLPDGSHIDGTLTGLSPEGLAVLRLDDGSRLTLASGVLNQ